MISKPTLQGLGKYFKALGIFATTPFQWDGESLRLRTYSCKNLWKKTAYIIAYIANNILLLGKNVFLLYFLHYHLIPENDVAAIVFQAIFVATYFCASFHNLLFCRTRKTVPNLFNEFCNFNLKTQGEYQNLFVFFNLHIFFSGQINPGTTTYPEKEDPMGPLLTSCCRLIVIFPLGVFLLSISSPRMTPFFGRGLPPSWTEGLVLRVVLAILEMYLMGYAWACNLKGFFLIIDQAFFLTYWMGQLNHSLVGGKMKVRQK